MTRRESLGDSVPVPRDVLDGIEAVRLSGRTNMLDRSAVARVADELGHRAAVLWIHEHPSEYARGMFCGLRAEHDASSEMTEPKPNDSPNLGAPDA